MGGYFRTVYEYLQEIEKLQEYIQELKTQCTNLAGRVAELESEKVWGVQDECRNTESAIDCQNPDG